MGVLDSIIKRKLISGPETVSATFSTDYISIDDIQDDFSVNFVYDNGSSVNMTISLQVSSDGTNFVNITDSDQVITDASGSHLWDVAGTGAIYLRVHIEVVSGAIDVQSILFHGKRLH